MSEQYPGGYMTKSPPTPDGTTAPGLWTLSQQAGYQKQGVWPLVNPPDPYFEYVAMLLHGDGTNGAQNNTFLDSSANAFTITRNGNTTQGSFSPYGANWSNFFDAANGNRLTWSFPSSAVQNAVSGTNYTIEFWVFRLPRAGTYQCIFSTENDRNNFIIDSSDNLLITSNGGTSMFTVAANTYIPTNTWTHVALVCSSTTWTLYFNGTSYGTYNSASKTNYATGTAQLGGRNDMNGCGYLSNFRVSTTARYSGAFTPSTAPFTADGSTAMLACQSNRFIDTSTNAQSFTVNGSISVQRFSPFAPSAAYDTATIGGSGYFDGSGDSLSIAANSAFTFGTGDFCIEAWAYANTATGTIFSIESCFGVIIYPGAAMAVVNNSGFGIITDPNAFPLKQWVHVAYTRSSNTVRLFINGVLAASGTDSGNYTTSGTARIGLWLDGSSFGWNGYISNLRVVKGSAVYTAAFTPPTSPVTAITNTQLLCNMTNGAIFDNAMMNDLETVGNAQISTSVKKYGTGSLYFDGTGDYLIGPSTPNTNIDAGNFTFEAWVYLTDATQVNPIVAKGFGAAGGYMMWVQSTLRVRVYDSGGTSYTATSTGTIPNNTWTFVAGVRNGNTITLYINGTADGSVSYSGTSTNSNPIEVGGYGTGVAVTNGYIDDLRITKGYARYTANFTPPTQAFQNN